MLKIEIDGQWIEYDNLLPLKNNLKLDESLDHCVVERIVNSKDPLPVLTKVILVDNSKEFEYLVKNSPTNRTGYKHYIQTLELVEPLEMTKGIEVDTLMITQPLEPDALHPKMMLDDVIDKILEVTPSTTLVRENETLKFKFELDSGIRAVFSEIESPDFPFSERMLFDVLVDVGAFVDMFPRIKFGNYMTNGKLMITFDELDIKDKNSYAISETTAIETQQPLENYANEVISNVKNLSVDSIVTYPSEGMGVYVNAPYGTIDITDTNAVITLPDRIKKVIKFEVFFGELISSEYLEYECPEYGEWQTRHPDSWGALVPYYKYNDYNIYNLKSWCDALPGGGETPKPVLRNSLFRITYIPYIDTEISEKNNSVVDYAVIYNQNSNIVEKSSFSKHLRNYVKRMENGDEVISCIYDNINDFPKLGHCVNGIVLTNLSYTKYYNYYDVTMQLSKNYTRRAEFIRAKNEMRTWEIPADGKIEDRLVVFSELINISAGNSNVGDKLNSLIDPTRIFYYFMQDKLSDGTMAVLNFKTRDGTTIPTMLVPYTTCFNNKILIEFASIDNTLLGYNKSLDWADEVNKQVGVTYTDEFGNFETVDIGFTDNYSLIIDPELFARNYPTSTESQNSDLYANCYFKIVDLNVRKDTREQFRFSYQLSVNGLNNTIVHENYVKNALKNVDGFTYKIWLLSEEISATDLIDGNILGVYDVTSTSIITISPPITIIDYNFANSTFDTNAKSIVLAYDDKPLLIINNPTVDQINQLKNDGIFKVYFS